jgi:hypothetical protein
VGRQKTPRRPQDGVQPDGRESGDGSTHMAVTETFGEDGNVGGQRQLNTTSQANGSKFKEMKYRHIEM